MFAVSAVTAMKCLYEGHWNTAEHNYKLLDLFELNMSYINLLPLTVMTYCILILITVCTKLFDAINIL